MNIFYLHNEPKTCAQQHVDKHVVKMIVEYAQLLSTAHRILDGAQHVGLSDKGRKRTSYVLDDDREHVLYRATHVNHPSAKWCRHSLKNYHWLVNLWMECLKEYTHRYGKQHSCERLIDHLRFPPTNIPVDVEFSAPWRAMPDEFKFDRNEDDYTVKSYRAYYIGAKSHMFKWKNRERPEWANELQAA